MTAASSATSGPRTDSLTNSHLASPALSRRVELSWVDAVYALATASTVGTYVHLSRGSFFWADDWPLAFRGRTFGDLFNPYNGQLSLVPIAVYQVLYRLFGFSTYLPWRIVGISALASVSVAMYLLLRSRVGALLAGTASIALLWMPHTALAPSTMSHWLATTATIVCAYALGRRDVRGDVTIACALAFALASAGGGIATAVGCVVYALCTHAGLRRWMAILVPCGLWFTWSRFHPEATRQQPVGLQLDTRHVIRLAIEGMRATFDALVFGNHTVGTLLSLAFVAVVVLRLRSGLAAATNAIAWTVAFVAWWVGLAHSRGILTDPHSVRYQLMGAVLVLLAVVPVQPTRLRSRFRSPLAALALALVAVLFAGANGPAIADRAAFQRAIGRATQRHAISAYLGAPYRAGTHTLGFELGLLTTAQYRQLVARYGFPAGTSPTAAEKLVKGRGFELVRDRPPRECARPNNRVRAPADSVVRIATQSGGATVELERFATSPMPIGDVPPNTSVTLRLSGPTRTGMVSAPGACVEIVQRSPGT